VAQAGEGQAKEGDEDTIEGSGDPGRETGGQRGGVRLRCGRGELFFHKSYFVQRLAALWAAPYLSGLNRLRKQSLRRPKANLRR
jgi:hypothetical protein